MTAAWIVLTIWTLAAFGLAYIIGHSTITLPFRTWLIGPMRLDRQVNDQDQIVSEHWAPEVWWRGKVVQFLECPACLGFWEGVAGGIWSAAAGGGSSAVPPWSLPIAAALYTCATNFLLARASGLMKLD